MDFSSSYKHHVNKRYSVNVQLNQNCILCCCYAVRKALEQVVDFLVLSLRRWKEIYLEQEWWTLYFVVLFQSLDPSLGKKIEWFVLLYAIRCFSPSQESDKFSDIFQNHLSSVQYLHCTIVCSYDHIFYLLSFLITLQTSFHEIHCDFSVFESLRNTFFFLKAKLKVFVRQMVILACHFYGKL